MDNSIPCNRCQALSKSITAERRVFSRKLTIIEALKELLNTKHESYQFGVKQTIRDLRLQLDSEKAEIRNRLIIAVNTTKQLFDERQELREKLDSVSKELANYQLLSTQSAARVKNLELENASLKCKISTSKKKKKKRNDSEPEWSERLSLKAEPVASPDEGLDLSDGFSSIGSPFSEFSCESSERPVKIPVQPKPPSDMCEHCVKIIRVRHICGKICEEGPSESVTGIDLPPSKIPDVVRTEVVSSAVNSRVNRSDAKKSSQDNLSSKKHSVVVKTSENNCSSIPEKASSLLESVSQTHNTSSAIISETLPNYESLDNSVILPSLPIIVDCPLPIDRSSNELNSNGSCERIDEITLSSTSNNNFESASDSVDVPFFSDDSDCQSSIDGELINKDPSSNVINKTTIKITNNKEIIKNLNECSMIKDKLSKKDSINKGNCDNSLNCKRKGRVKLTKSISSSSDDSDVEMSDSNNKEKRINNKRNSSSQNSIEGSKKCVSTLKNVNTKNLAVFREISDRNLDSVPTTSPVLDMRNDTVKLSPVKTDLKEPYKSAEPSKLVRNCYENDVSLVQEQRIGVKPSMFDIDCSDNDVSLAQEQCRDVQMSMFDIDCPENDVSLVQEQRKGVKPSMFDIDCSDNDVSLAQEPCEYVQSSMFDIVCPENNVSLVQEQRKGVKPSMFDIDGSDNDVSLVQEPCKDVRLSMLDLDSPESYLSPVKDPHKGVESSIFDINSSENDISLVQISHKDIRPSSFDIECPNNYDVPPVQEPSEDVESYMFDLDCSENDVSLVQEPHKGVEQPMSAIDGSVKDAKYVEEAISVNDAISKSEIDVTSVSLSSSTFPVDNLQEVEKSPLQIVPSSSIFHDFSPNKSDEHFSKSYISSAPSSVKSIESFLDLSRSDTINEESILKSNLLLKTSNSQQDENYVVSTPTNTVSDNLKCNLVNSNESKCIVMENQFVSDVSEPIVKSIDELKMINSDKFKVIDSKTQGTLDDNNVITNCNNISNVEKLCVVSHTEVQTAFDKEFNHFQSGGQSPDGSMDDDYFDCQTPPRCDAMDVPSSPDFMNELRKEIKNFNLISPLKSVMKLDFDSDDGNFIDNSKLSKIGKCLSFDSKEDEMGEVVPPVFKEELISRCDKDFSESVSSIKDFCKSVKSEICDNWIPLKKEEEVYENDVKCFDSNIDKDESALNEILQEALNYPTPLSPIADKTSPVSKGVKSCQVEILTDKPLVSYSSDSSDTDNCLSGSENSLEFQVQFCQETKPESNKTNNLKRKRKKKKKKSKISNSLNSVTKLNITASRPSSISPTKCNNFDKINFIKESSCEFKSPPVPSVKNSKKRKLVSSELDVGRTVSDVNCTISENSSIVKRGITEVSDDKFLTLLEVIKQEYSLPPLVSNHFVSLDKLEEEDCDWMISDESLKCNFKVDNAKANSPSKCINSKRRLSADHANVNGIVTLSKKSRKSLKEKIKYLFEDDRNSLIETVLSLEKEQKKNLDLCLRNDHRSGDEATSNDLMKVKHHELNSEKPVSDKSLKMGQESNCSGVQTDKKDDLNMNYTLSDSPLSPDSVGDEVDLCDIPVISCIDSEGTDNLNEDRCLNIPSKEQQDSLLLSDEKCFQQDENTIQKSTISDLPASLNYLSCDNPPLENTVKKYVQRDENTLLKPTSRDLPPLINPLNDNAPPENPIKECVQQNDMVLKPKSRDLPLLINPLNDNAPPENPIKECVQQNDMLLKPKSRDLPASINNPSFDNNNIEKYVLEDKNTFIKSTNRDLSTSISNPSFDNTPLENTVEKCVQEDKNTVLKSTSRDLSAIDYPLCDNPLLDDYGFLILKKSKFRKFYSKYSCSVKVRNKKLKRLLPLPRMKNFELSKFKKNCSTLTLCYEDFNFSSTIHAIKLVSYHYIKAFSPLCVSTSALGALKSSFESETVVSDNCLFDRDHDVENYVFSNINMINESSSSENLKFDKNINDNFIQVSNDLCSKLDLNVSESEINPDGSNVVVNNCNSDGKTTLDVRSAEDTTHSLVIDSCEDVSIAGSNIEESSQSHNIDIENDEMNQTGLLSESFIISSSIEEVVESFDDSISLDGDNLETSVPLSTTIDECYSFVNIEAASDNDQSRVSPVEVSSSSEDETNLVLDVDNSDNSVSNGNVVDVVSTLNLNVSSYNLDVLSKECGQPNIIGTELEKCVHLSKMSVERYQSVSSDIQNRIDLEKNNCQNLEGRNTNIKTPLNLLSSHKSMASFGKLVNLQFSNESRMQHASRDCVKIINNHKYKLSVESNLNSFNYQSLIDVEKTVIEENDLSDESDNDVLDVTSPGRQIVVSGESAGENVNNTCVSDQTAVCIDNDNVPVDGNSRDIDVARIKFSFYTRDEIGDMPYGIRDKPPLDDVSTLQIEEAKGDFNGGSCDAWNAVGRRVKPPRPDTDMIQCKTNAFECSLEYWHDYARLNPKPKVNNQITNKDLQLLENCVLELTNCSSEENALERIQVIGGKIEHIDSGHIADIIVDAVYVDCGEVELKYTPPAPPLTPLQRRLLLLLSYLARGREEYFLTVLKALEEPVVSFVDKYCISKLSNLVRFHTALCRQLGLLSRSRAFLYDILYCKGLKIYLLVFSMLPLWVEILPSADASQDCLLTQTIVYILTHFVPHQKFDISPYQINLKQFLEDAYEYNKMPLSRDILCNKLIDNIRLPGASLALVLLCKREEWVWASKIMETKVHPIVSSWIQDQIDEDTATQAVLCLGSVVRGYPMNVATNSIKRSRDLLESVLNHQKSLDVMEAAVNAICMLRRHDLFSCSLIFTKWRPVDGKITKSMADNIKTVLSAKQLTYWKKFLARYT